MTDTVFIALLYNSALLLAMVLVFDIAASRYRIADSRIAQTVAGVVLGAIAVGVMMAPFKLAPGIVFDTRSVILAMAGLFFGAVPTVIAVAIAAAYRMSLGGGGAITGALVVAASGFIGWAWGQRRSGQLEHIRGRELYLLGLVVHGVMLALMLTLPGGVGMSVIASIGLPVMLIHPLATTALGSLLANRLGLDRSERALEKSETLYRSLVDNLPQNIYRTDLDGRITFANRVFLDTLGRTREELIGTSVYALHPPAVALRQRAVDAEVIGSGELLTVSDQQTDPLTGELREYEVMKAPIRGSGGRIEGLQCVFSDITERRRAEARIHHLAFFDTLTGLPNRALLMDRLSQTLASGLRNQRVEALLLLNIDRFKVINDARGYRIGDALLSVVGERLNKLLRGGDTLARMNGDEFAIILPGAAGAPDRANWRALDVAENIHEGLKHPLDVDGEEFSITVSIGVTPFPDAGDETPEGIMRRADTALHRAKAGGGDQTAFFDSQMGETAAQSFRVERDLRHALAHRELRLHLQSQVHPENGVVGAEALVRWEHPSRGLLYPGAFIPIAEESSLIVKVGTWVLAEACSLMAIERRAGRRLRLSVNVSPRHFRQRDFVPWLKGLIETSGADARDLTLEITEGLVINNIAEIATKLHDLAAIGIRFSIDDFGTGYSSLAYLKRLPIHELKIDKSFIQDAPDDPNDAALVETILAVASHLQLEVVAEGIETEEQAAFLSQRATIIHQGYLYGRPTPAADWLDEWRALV